jgi:hypothetical protein
MLQLEGVTMDQLNAINDVVAALETVEKLGKHDWPSDGHSRIADAEEAIDNLLPWSLYDGPFKGGKRVSPRVRARLLAELSWGMWPSFPPSSERRSMKL